MLNFPNINPVIIPLGPLAVSWYSLAYVAGILLGWFYILKLISINMSTNISKKNVDDFVTWAMIGIIIGGRLGYVLFYDPIKYFSNPIDILKTYKGGMSFHGGIIGYTIALAWFAQRNKISFMSIADLSATAAPIPLFLGRIANFINSELYGRVTDVPWAFIFPGSDYLPRHPSQLYEAILEGVILFCIVCVAALNFNALSRDGLLSGLFLIFYSIFRIIIEFFREPDIQIGLLAGAFTMGQLLCLPMLIIGIFLIFYSKKCP